MATSLEDTIKYYKDLLLYQYINENKASSTINLLVSQALVDLLPVELQNAFVLDTATGPQLDILGEYIGFDRVVKAPVDRNYFVFDDYGTPPSDFYGMTDYTDPLLNSTNSVYLYVFYETPNNALEDSEYRILLKLKALMNISTNSIYEINTLLNEFFGTDVFCADQKNMSLSYFVTDEYSRIIAIAASENLLPKPMGVLISGIFNIEDIDDIFGFASYTSESGSDIGLSDSTVGFADGLLLDYSDEVA